ncbi:MAG: hypothetical protein LIO37_01060 [Clostridiales bacterium]|nr:hypothetical protein [Clostridiales bacterium]
MKEKDQAVEALNDYEEMELKSQSDDEKMDLEQVPKGEEDAAIEPPPMDAEELTLEQRLAFTDIDKMDVDGADRFVWHDEVGYKKLQKRLAIIFVIGLVPALAFYIPLRQYTDAPQFATAIFVIIFGILFGIFHRRIFNNVASYVRCDGILYRMGSANRGITRLSLDNEADAPYFEKDFKHSLKTDSTYAIVDVRRIEEDKKGYYVSASVRKTRSKKLADKSFFIEKGYNDMELLMEELRARQESEKQVKAAAEMLEESRA